MGIDIKDASPESPAETFSMICFFAVWHYLKMVGSLLLAFPLIHSSQ
jgi:hypothetical protein